MPPISIGGAVTVILTKVPIRRNLMKSDIEVIKEGVTEIRNMLDELMRQHETIGMMKLSERSLQEFLEDEPDIYTLDDAKVVYL
jgi:hypothetical protein